MADNVEENKAAVTGQPAPDTKASPYAWYVLSILVLIYVLNFVDRQILSILANDIKKDLGLSDAQLGFLYGTAFAVFYSLFGIPLGKLADSWNRVRLMTVGLGLWSAMTALSGFARDGIVLTAARIGVGVGEATASPSAYSLISDYFPKRMRATALAIYSSGLYIGGGISLIIGAAVVENWNSAYPDGGPLGLVGWQAAFLVVGIPGLLLAILVSTLREPVRGQVDGIATPPSPAPFRGFVEELFAVIPPFTLVGAARRGSGALLRNVMAAAIIYAIAFAMTIITFIPGQTEWIGLSQQWLFIGVGCYAVTSWATNLKEKDPPTFAMIWGSPAFLATTLAYGTVAFGAYSAGYWAAPYAERAFGLAKEDLALWIGAPGAVAGFLGVIAGGRIADILRQRYASGRVMVLMFGMLGGIPTFILAFTTGNPVLFYILLFISSLITAMALAPAAATTQDLVLPRMRGTATATFFLGTSLIGLALGPYLAGLVSTRSGDNLSLGMLSTLAIVPIGLTAAIVAFRRLPKAEASLVERARAAGEPI